MGMMPYDIELEVKRKVERKEVLMTLNEIERTWLIAGLHDRRIVRDGWDTDFAESYYEALCELDDEELVTEALDVGFLKM